jgi:hypothetical protein
MVLDNYFPSTIGREEHLDWLPRVRPLLDEIFTGPADSLDPNFYKNGQTTYGKRNLVDDPKFSDFINFVSERGRHYLDIQGYQAPGFSPMFFANSFNRGSAHCRHVHSGCSISGIYYVDTPPGSSQIIFTPNNSFKDFFDYMWRLKPGEPNWYSMMECRYNPYPGLLLFWPAWLYHEVPPNDSNEPRRSIVFNL